MSVVVPVREWFASDDWRGLWQKVALKARDRDDCGDEKAWRKGSGLGDAQT